MINYCASTFPSSSLSSYLPSDFIHSVFTNWDYLVPKTLSASSIDPMHHFSPLPGTTTHYKTGKPMSRVLISGISSPIVNCPTILQSLPWLLPSQCSPSCWAMHQSSLSPGVAGTRFSGSLTPRPLSVSLTHMAFTCHLLVPLRSSWYICPFQSV